MNKKLFFAGVVSTLFVAASTLAIAQVRLQANPRPAANAPMTISPAALSAIYPAQTLNYSPSLMANMSGWVKVTDASIKGSPALSWAGGGPAQIIVVGGNNTVYLAYIDLKNPAPLGNVWTTIPKKIDNGISCENIPALATTLNYVKWTNCFSLGASGNVVNLSIAKQGPSAALQNVSLSSWGGQNADGLPLGISFPVNLNINAGGNRIDSIVTVVADYNLWKITKVLKNVQPTGGEPNVFYDYNISKIPNVFVGSAAACTNEQSGGIACVARSVNNFVRLLRVPQSNGTAPTILANDETWKNFVNSPQATSAAAQELTSAPAIVSHPSGKLSIFIRDNDGSLKHIDYNTSNNTWGNWVDEGGYLAQGSQPSCLADGEASVCAIQGADGAPYIKRL